MARPPSEEPVVLPVTLLHELADKIFDLYDWPAREFGSKRLDQLRSCFESLELKPSALNVIRERVLHRSLALVTTPPQPLVRRQLFPSEHTDWERDKIFRGIAIRGPCCYLKLRLYDHQPPNGVADFGDACYYATVGVAIVPAMPPLINFMAPVNEFTRVEYSSKPTTQSEL